MALTIPLMLYGIPYAYAATVGQTTIVSITHTIVSTDLTSIDLQVNCPSGDYATGGSAGTDLDTTNVVPTFSGPTVGGTVAGSGTPDGWRAGFNFDSTSAVTFDVGGVLELFVICQAPITVAGIGVPQFGSLYLAIALGALVYFVMARRVSLKTATPRTS